MGDKRKAFYLPPTLLFQGALTNALLAGIINSIENLPNELVSVQTLRRARRLVGSR